VQRKSGVFKRLAGIYRLVLGWRRKYMRGLPLIAVFLMMGLSQGTAFHYNDWRGIVPLHSTKADVERLLGPPPPPPKDGTSLYTPGPASSYYFFESEDVRIAYMTDELAERTECSSFPVDIVIGIVVYLKNHPPLNDLGIDQNKFVTHDPSQPPNLGFLAYVDNKDGVSICTRAGKVWEILYYGEATDRQVCPNFNGDPTKSCSVLVGD
jgi:hypothetical protein